VVLHSAESTLLEDYSFRYRGLTHFSTDNYEVDEAVIEVEHKGKTLALLHPQKRRYPKQSSPTTEVAIQSYLMQDFYVAMGEALDQEGNWSFRIYLKPMMRWIWMGWGIMAMGGLMAAFGTFRKEEH
jgi:cytochrome c-type biogenesis protein CcmF